MRKWWILWLLILDRLLHVNNQTFAGLTELSRLNLASNRFTTTFRLEYFAKNLYLNDIWLGDNPWRCECWGFGLKEFYQYLTVPPQRVCICGVMHLMAHVIRFNRFFFIRRRTTAHNYVAPVQKKYRADIGMWRVARLGIPSNGRWAPLKKSGRSSWSVSSLGLSTFAYLWASKNGYGDEPNVVVRKSDCRWSRMLVKCKYFQWVIIAIQLDVILLIFLQ